MRIITLTIILACFIAVMTGCSGSSGVLTPETPNLESQGAMSHSLWGMWQFSADPATQTLDVAQLRSGDMHINALRFLEPPVNLYLTVSNVKFNGNILDLDVTLRHPFIGMPQYTGFDVCGVLISDGSTGGFVNSEILMPGDSDVRLLNPDGYTRWWNPVEFPHEDTIFGYKDGLLGTPDDTANYTATLNGYKFFCDAINNPDDPLSSVDPTSRCEFKNGMDNTRHYSIQLVPSGLVFNYVIDTAWRMPTGGPPWDVPDDFPAGANRPEAWNIVVKETANTLWHDGSMEPSSGGGLSLSIDVWDHFDAELNTVTVESPGNFDAVSSSTPIVSGQGFCTYLLDIPSATPAPGNIDLLITVQSQVNGYQGLLPGKPVSAYFTHRSLVSDQGPSSEECGNEVYTTWSSTPFQDQNQTNVKYEIAFLETGPYAGEMLVLSGTDLIKRYNTDNIDFLNGNDFINLPPGSGIAYHLEVEPVAGRVLVVCNTPNEPNNTVLIYDDQGNPLLPDGFSVGAGRRIQAMDLDDNGDLWMMTGEVWSWVTINVKLERWKYLPDAPYYEYDPSSDLEVASIVGKPSGDTWVVENDIADQVISYTAKRLFIFQQAQVGEHNGRLYVFDLHESGPPEYRPDLSIMELFSSGTWRGFNDNHKNAYGGIWIDHTVQGIDDCRVLIYGRRIGDMVVMLIKLDALDCTVTAETVLDGLVSPYTMGVNMNPDKTKRNLIFVNWQPWEAWMSPPPAGW